MTIIPEYKYEFFKRIIDKLLSARFLVVIMLVLTFCYCTVKGIKLGQDFIFILTTAVTYYFTRQDRKQKNDPQ